MARTWLAMTLLAVLATLATAADEPISRELRYRFVVGDVLVYETTTTVSGQVLEKANATAVPVAVPIELRVHDRTAYEVKAVDKDGLATLEARLLLLEASTDDSGQPRLHLERRADQTALAYQGQTWSLPPADQLERAPEEVLRAFSGWDPRHLLASYAFTLSPVGGWRRRSGQPWPDHLAKLNGLGQFAAWAQPLGRLWPELPSAALTAGDEWDQTRTIRLPSSRDRSYGLTVTYTVGDLTKDASPVSFDGAQVVQDQPIRLTLAPRRNLNLTITALSHRLTGDFAIDAKSGRLTQANLRSEVACQTQAPKPSEPSVDSNLVVEAKSQLVPSAP